MGLKILESAMAWKKTAAAAPAAPTTVGESVDDIGAGGNAVDGVSNSRKRKAEDDESIDIDC